MSDSWPTWDAWLAQQNEPTRARALELADKFREAGCASPEDWVRSEVDEDFAQLARFLFLRLLWNDLLQQWRSTEAVQQLPSAKRLVDAGTDPEALREFGAAAVSEAVWQTLTLLDGVWAHPLIDDPSMPGWRVLEVDGESGEPTGREVAALHESLREADPEQRDGDPLF